MISLSNLFKYLMMLTMKSYFLLPIQYLPSFSTSVSWLLPRYCAPSRRAWLQLYCTLPLVVVHGIKMVEERSI